jgi:Protein of unknown function (DUF2946)
MRLRRLRGNGWAVRLAILALALNALVPVHLAFDLADALAPAAHHAAGGHGLAWRLLARLSGHLRPAGDHGKNHSECPVCSALASLGGAPPAAAPVLPVPLAIAAATISLQSLVVREAAPAAAYRSRAPPLA